MNKRGAVMAKEHNFFKMEMLILLILKQGNCYGYELAGILKKQTEGIIDIKMGTLYPILYKLADDHCITGLEVREGRRTKIIYKLEPKGEALLVTLQKRYTVWVQAIDMIMKGA